jgi:hypothetical protein
MEQTNTTRTAILKANETFDYDIPSMLENTVCVETISLVGAPRVWFIYILAKDNGKPQRQGKKNNV